MWSRVPTKHHIAGIDYLVWPKAPMETDTLFSGRTFQRLRDYHPGAQQGQTFLLGKLNPSLHTGLSICMAREGVVNFVALAHCLHRFHVNIGNPGGPEEYGDLTDIHHCPRTLL